MPLVSRTRATLRSAEFGFFGVWVKTRTQTPRFCGLFCSAGLLVLLTIFLRPARTSWLMVGIRDSQKSEVRSLKAEVRLETATARALDFRLWTSYFEACFRPESRGLAPENPSCYRDGLI